MKDNIKFHYNVLEQYNENKYKKRLTESHIVSDKFPLKMGVKWDEETCKEVPNYQSFYILRKDRVKYALLASERDKLPIIVSKSREHFQGGEAYELIERFASVKPQPELKMDFRTLVDELCSFQHTCPKDFTLWKICSVASIISRTVFRVATEPSFGKDSVITCLGALLGDTANLNKPTVAKLEFELTNKLILMNELGTLSGEARQKMEDFLLNIGDMKNTHKKASRAGKGTKEEYSISKLSMILAFNTIDCYPNREKYFDFVFNKAVYDRFIPFKLQGKLVENIAPPLFAKRLAEQYTPFYEDFIRSIMYLTEHMEELAMKKGFNTTTAGDYDIPSRWQRSLNVFVMCIHLYSNTEKEAQEWIDTLIDRHKAYLRMIRTEDTGGFEAFEVKEERVM